MSKFYAVAKGRNPEIYKTWIECQNQISKFPRMKSPQKKATSFLAQNQNPIQKQIPKSSTFSSSLSSSLSSSSHSSSSDKTKTQPEKKQQIRILYSNFNNHQYKHQKQKQEQESKQRYDQVQKNITFRKNSNTVKATSLKRKRKKSTLKTKAKKLTKYQEKKEKRKIAATQVKLLINSFPPSSILCWTDGSCLSNPKGPGGSATLIQVPLDIKKPRDVNKNMTELTKLQFLPSCTNNSAELTAISLAFDVLDSIQHSLLKSQSINIMTDSRYCEKVLTDQWQITKNLDLIQTIKEKNFNLKEKGYKIKYHWIRGHSDIPENSTVDQLAYKVATKEIKPIN